MSVVICGAHTYLGSRLFDRLSSDGMTVSALSEYSPRITRHTIDEGDTVVYLDDYSGHGVYKSVYSHVTGLSAVIDICRIKNASRIIYGSSYRVYGRNVYIPVYEHDTKMPFDLYGLTKMWGEDLLYESCGITDDERSFPFTVLRFSKVYGPGCRDGFIFDTMKSVLESVNPPVYFGEQTRDFIYVDDAVDALCLILNNGKIRSNRVGAFNIGSGSEISLNSLASKIIELCGVDGVEVSETTHDLGVWIDYPRMRLNLDKIDMYGWKPKVSLDDGLREVYEWMSKT